MNVCKSSFMTSEFFYFLFYVRDHMIGSRSSSGVVVKLLVCGARGPGSIPGLAATISEIGCLLLPSRDMAENRLSGVNPLNNKPITWLGVYCFFLTVCLFVVNFAITLNQKIQTSYLTSIYSANESLLDENKVMTLWYWLWPVCLKYIFWLCCHRWLKYFTSTFFQMLFGQDMHAMGPGASRLIESLDIVLKGMMQKARNPFLTVRSWKTNV